jgi:hypothetical protein
VLVVILDWRNPMFTHQLFQFFYRFHIMFYYYKSKFLSRYYNCLTKLVYNVVLFFVFVFVFIIYYLLFIFVFIYFIYIYFILFLFILFYFCLFYFAVFYLFVFIYLFCCYLFIVFFQKKRINNKMDRKVVNG